MTTKVIRIGNSRGIRLPADVLASYNLRDGDEIQIDRRQEGILLSVVRRTETISYEDAYRAMQLEVAERAEWDEWDGVAGDGNED